MKSFKLLPAHKYTDGRIEVGVDEVGRGCLAGPVVTAAVILPENFSNILIQDSKKLIENEREQMYQYIIDNAIEYNINFIDNEIIDKINILEATMLSMNKSIAGLKTNIDTVLIDGNRFKTYLNEYNKPIHFVSFETIVKGDSLYASIAAASILAKVSRDRYMKKISAEYPQYGWETNMGYGTKKHMDAIKQYGYTPYHRTTFKIK